MSKNGEKHSLNTSQKLTPPLFFHFSLITKTSLLHLAEFSHSAATLSISKIKIPHTLFMADEISPSFKPQAPFQEAASNHPSKYYGHFPFKTAFVTVFLVLLPLFQCEILNQSVNATSWELLQLIFVGIAVSYGLFSKKSEEIEKDHGLKLDNAHSYVSKLLQVSSVFDDESENETVIDENRVQTWNSQFYKGEPVVIVSNENPNFKEENGVTSGISKKSLLLPVRSLRQPVPEPIEIDLVDESLLKRSSSNSSSKGLSTNLSIPKNGEFGGRISQKEEMEEKTEDNIVLPSPIPWRSRSGRMEMEENGDNPEFRLQAGSLNSNTSSKNISPSSLSPPQKLSNSASFSIESQVKNSEDVARKFSSTPPSPLFPQKYLKKSNSSEMSSSVSSEKEFRRRVQSLPTEELSDSEIEELYERMNPSSEWRGRMVNNGLMKSVRTFRSSEPVTEAEKMSSDHDTKFVGEKGYLEENNELLEKILMENSDDEDSDDDLVGSLGNGEAVNSDNGNDPVPDVDKKADEFIAKFREQIGLQRINSIRKSTADSNLRT